LGNSEFICATAILKRVEGRKLHAALKNFDFASFSGPGVQLLKQVFVNGEQGRDILDWHWIFFEFFGS
jgi:hypothetical protein